MRNPREEPIHESGENWRKCRFINDNLACSDIQFLGYILHEQQSIKDVTSNCPMYNFWDEMRFGLGVCIINIWRNEALQVITFSIEHLEITKKDQKLSDL